MMEAVLPLKISGDWSDHDLTRARILLYSLETFWRGTGRLRLNVIAREQDMDVLAQALVSDVIDIVIVPELEVVPELVQFPNAHGWYKQQVIKLSSYQLIDGAFFLTLDADLVCSKPFDESTFVVQGRLLADWEPRAVHPDWWRDSANVLGIEPIVEGQGIKPTPVVLSTSQCRQLMAFLDERGGGSGKSYLLGSKGWTEFTLYNSFLDMTDQTSDTYLTAEEMAAERRAVRSWACFSSRREFDNWNPAAAFGVGSPGHFMVCNSSTRIDPQEVWEKLVPCFEQPPSYEKIDGQRFRNQAVGATP
jgi:hypothetical protein